MTMTMIMIMIVIMIMIMIMIIIFVTKPWEEKKRLGRSNPTSESKIGTASDELFT